MKFSHGNSLLKMLYTCWERYGVFQKKIYVAFSLFTPNFDLLRINEGMLKSMETFDFIGSF